jgi:hypothetical protein
MSHTFTITISDTDFKALQYIAVDPDEWFENMVTSRASVSKLDIQKVFIAYKTEREESIPGGGIDAQVEAAFSEGIVTTAAEANANLTPPGMNP